MGSEGYRVLAANPDHPKRRIVVAIVGHEQWETDRANAEHIAAFDPPTALQLLDGIDQVLELCDTWDALSKGPTPTTTRIRSAINGRHS